MWACANPNFQFPRRSAKNVSTFAVVKVSASMPALQLPARLAISRMWTIAIAVCSLGVQSSRNPSRLAEWARHPHARDIVHRAYLLAPGARPAPRQEIRTG